MKKTRKEQIELAEAKKVIYEFFKNNGLEKNAMHQTYNINEKFRQESLSGWSKGTMR